jgi:HK97 family phage major capsid protein
MTDIEVIKSVYAELGIEFSELSIDEDEPIEAKAESAKADVGTNDIGSSNFENIAHDEEKNMSDNTQETQVQPQDAPVTREEIKGMFSEFGQELMGALKSNDKPAPPAVPVNAGQTIVDKGVNIHPHPIGGGDDSDGMKAFYQYCRTGHKNSGLKALEGGTDSEGGYIVPSPQHNMIIERRDLASVVRQAPNFSRFSTTATTYDIPVEGDDSAAMDATAEEAAATQNDPVFGNVSGVITKYTREIRYSNELDDDNSANFMGFLSSRVGREMAKAENAALDVELFANGTAALTLDSNSAIAASEIPEITGLLPASWETGAIWNMRKSTGSLIRGLQGNDFLFMPTPSAVGGNGSQWMLDGYPVYYNDQVAAMAADAQVISFYNPEAVGVIDRQGLSVLVDPYSLSSTGQVKLVYSFRFDVVVLQAQAVLEIICPGA